MERAEGIFGIEFTGRQVADMRFAIRSIRQELDRIEAIFATNERQPRPMGRRSGAPVRRTPRYLSSDDVDACWRMFDAGRSRYDVSVALGITFLAANRRYMGWLKAGGRNREGSGSASPVTA